MQKDQQGGQLFGPVLRPRPFLAPKNQNPQIRPKPKIFQYQSIDISQKMAQLWPKIRMPLYVIIGILRDFLAHNLTKCQYFL